MSYLLNHRYKILIIGVSGSGKNNTFLKVEKLQRPDFDKIDLFVKDPFESNYQLLINERETLGIKKSKNPKRMIEYSQTIDDGYENLEDYNPTKKTKELIAFDDMIADMEANKSFIPIVTELFLRGRMFNLSLVFISQSYFKEAKTIRLNATHNFIMKIPNKR